MPLLRYLSLPLLLCSTLLADANPLQGIFSPENLKLAKISGVDVAPGPRPDSIVLKFHPADQPGTFILPLPPAARDWTSYAAFAFHFTSTSTIRFSVQIRNRQGQEFSYRLQPFQGVSVKAVIPANFLTRDYLNNRQFKGYWASNWGNHIDLAAVESLTISMFPNRAVTLEFGPLALLREPAADEFYLDHPVVDAFGQWISLEWPGKLHSLDELRQAWRQEDADLSKPRDFGFCRYGGWKQAPHPGGPPFFHTAQVDGKWWLVDPDGHLFFSVGPDCVRYSDPTRVAGREKLFAKLPPGAGDTTDFYRANAGLRYGEPDFVARWKAQAYERLRAWGFNTVANWSSPVLFENPEAPFVTNVRIGSSAKSWQGFPDAFSEEFARSAAESAQRQCAPFRDQSYLIGYFIGNEPRWPYRGLPDLILNDPSPSETQAFARRFLAGRGSNAAARDALLEALSRKYFGVIAQAIHAADPNHLVLGIRYAGQAPDPVLRASDVFDVFSINIYRFEPPAAMIHRISSLVKKPVLIGEFHFGAAERGFAPSLVMVKDQAARGVAYQYYMERAAALSEIIGAHYFQLVDEPVTGRFDGENYNLGFLDQLDLPYPEMVAAARATHRRIYPIHAGALRPTDRAAAVR